jgi:TIGR03009 family protein
MRPAGLTLAAVLVGVSVVTAQPLTGQPLTGQPLTGQPSGVPGMPVVPPPPGGASAADARLDAHLAGWEKTMNATTNFRVVLGLKRTDAVFKQEKTYSGVVLCMKPNLAVLRLNYDGDRTGADYEAYICDGKAVYEYNGLQKTITRWKLPDPKANPNGGATDNLMLDFLSGMKAKEAKERFEITLYKEDPQGYYIYLDVKPRLAKDKAEFQQLRMALYGPNTKWTYLPAQVFLVKPNGDTEQWSFKEPQTNIPGVEEKMFQFTPVKDFKFQEGQAAPPPPAGRPGQPKLPAAGGLPAGEGAVRPSNPYPSRP